MKDADVIVVGSGASGVHAALALVESGVKVLMVDAGHSDARYRALVPAKSFEEIRSTDADQHRYFLGERFEGIPLEEKEAAPQATPPRQYVFERTSRWLPAEPAAENFSAMESFAQGGLAGAWGAVAFPFDSKELEACGLPPKEMAAHYDAVAAKIGVTRCGDDLIGSEPVLKSVLPSAEMAAPARAILQKYRVRRAEFLKQGIRAGEPSLALLTKPLGGRQANAYHDMDFWSNEGNSVYRPEITLEEMKAMPNFSYAKPYAVESFSEAPHGASIKARHLGNGDEKVFKADRIILAAGTLGTARIVLRSLDQYDVRVPVVCNPHAYVVGLVREGLMKPLKAEERRHSLAQLSLSCDSVQAQLYFYRSLLIFRLLAESRLAQREALRIFRNLAPNLALWVVQHEDRPSDGKYLRLEKTQDGDKLEIVYKTGAGEAAKRKEQLKNILSAISKLGIQVIRPVEKRAGASIHYGGAFPASAEERPLTTGPSGLLYGTRGVYVADGSVFRYLPAKGPTLTLMANARRIAKGIAARVEAHS